MAEHERGVTRKPASPADDARPDDATRHRPRRPETDQLIAEADALIDRVLSGDSEAFNASVRQRGGQ